MTGIVASIGLRAAAGMLAGKVKTGAIADVKAAGSWFGRRTPLELIGFVALAIAVVQHFSLVHTRHARDDAVAGRAAAMQQLGNALKALKNSQANETLLRSEIADTNGRITQQSKQLATEQDQLSKARQKGAASIAEAKAAGQRHADAALQKPAPDEACGPSGAQKDKWS